KEVERKKPKQNTFDAARKVGDAIAPRASAFALEILKNFKYCKIGISHRRDGMALRPLASSRPSKNVVKDRDLTWRQFSVGKNNMLTAMEKHDWSRDSLRTLAAFWYNLELHPQHIKPSGERILLTYQAKVRLEWHDALDVDEGFDISEINETLMRSIGDDIWDEIRYDGIRQVSFYSVVLLHISNTLSYSHAPRE
ncbi:hypothetical protein B0H13DRAFT_1599493, partial [Mycena leptocephala]